MFKMIQTRPEGSDCTAPYDVILDKTYTVEEFVKTVLENKPNEWGFIGVYKKGVIFGVPYVEYTHGVLVNTFPENYLSKTIKTVKASGGWSRMDYWLWLEE